MNNFNEKILPDNIKGRSLYKLIIPTVCNLRNMLNKLEEIDGDFNQLKSWEKRSYKSYNIKQIQNSILHQSEVTKKRKIKKHILSLHPDNIGSSCADIYLIAYIAHNYDKGRARAFEWIFENGITGMLNSAQAIWQVGKGDGLYLGVLNEDGSIKDYDFFKKWAGV
jgi:hypothetical protein